jgi:hypothetical protein
MVELYSESRRYTLLEVKDMTDNYAKKIGEDLSGTVYHGKLLTGREVAVKVWKPGYLPSADGFAVFQRVSSPNALISQPCLVFSYSLEYHEEL